MGHYGSSLLFEVFLEPLPCLQPQCSVGRTHKDNRGEVNATQTARVHTLCVQEVDSTKRHEGHGQSSDHSGRRSPNSGMRSGMLKNPHSEEEVS